MTTKKLHLLFLLGFWFIVQNNYFGWNSFPESDTELLADGIFFIILGMFFLAPNKSDE